MGRVIPCYGLPNGPCPQKRCDETVKLSQGDLMLCHDCELVHFPGQEHTITKISMPSSAVRESTENQSLPNDTHRAIPSAPPMSPSIDENYEREDVIIRNHDNNSEFILEPLLAYILFSLQSSTSENISKAVLGHFTPKQIFNAKEVLWGECDVKVIGQKIRRQ